MKNHDKVDRFGFDVSSQQLAHDLAIAKLSNDKSLKHEGDGLTSANEPSSWTSLDIEYFKRYEQWYDHFLAYLDDQTRYDSSFKD